MGAAWGRPRRLKIISSTTEADRGNTGEGGGGRSLQTNGGGTITTGLTGWSTTTATGTTTTTTTTSGSGSVQGQRSFDFFHRPAMAEIADELGEEERVKKLEDIKALVVRFRSDSSAPERWLSELQVNWVLHLAHGGKSGRSFISAQLLYLARSWILALFEITKSITTYFGGSCSKEEEDASEFTLFIKATLSMMLPFVDAVVAVRTSTGSYDRCWSAEPADEKLQALILLRDALSTATEHIQSHLLSAELLMAKLDKAIWDTMVKIKTAYVMPSSSSGIRRAYIHPITCYFIGYIKMLWANHGLVNHILQDALLCGHFMPNNENASHLTNLTVEIVHSLEEKLTRESQSFPDQSLKFVFLINNLHSIVQQLSPLGFPMPELAVRIHDYINSYIQVSWAPLLKCLHHNPTPHCTPRRSPLPEFESKFQETYTTQKLWQVPDPEMRKTMREAIVQEVIPDFTQFFKDNTISAPRITPQVMKKMLQELFEG